MVKVTVYGASDDLIEIEGDLREEFSYPCGDDDDKKVYLGFSDGTLLSVRYDGYWRFGRMVKGSAEFSKEEASDPDRNYSDRVTLVGDVRWVLMGSQFDQARSE